MFSFQDLRSTICLSISLYSCLLLSGCSNGEHGSAAVKGLPALELPEGAKDQPGVTGMAMDPVAHRLFTLDKNKNDQIDPEEFPIGGLPDYDENEDGTVTREELTKWVERKRIEGEAKKKARLAKKKAEEKKAGQSSENDDSNSPN